MLKSIEADDIKRYVVDWNIRFPMDRWWRDKHKVAFNSMIHRESCFIDQCVEFEEDYMYFEMREEELKLLSAKKEAGEDFSIKNTSYKAGKGNWLNRTVISNKQATEQFEKLKLDNFKF
jgi:hypothetical protein